MKRTSAEPPELDVRQQLERGLGFLRRALRFWVVPLVVLLLGGVACAAFLALNKPKFRSETVILYVERGSPTDANQPASAGRSVTIRLKELLMARPTLERVISAFDLYSDQRRALGAVDAIEELKKHIDFRAPGGDTFSIAFEGSSPQQAQSVTAKLARLVIDGDSELRRGQARVALDFLAGEKQGTESQLRDSEQKLASFMAVHPRFALDTTPLSNGAAIRASLGAAAPSPQAPGNLAGPQLARNGPASAGKPLAAPPIAASAPTGTGAGGAETEEARARAALAAARENLAEQLTHYTAAHPDVRAAQSAVDRAVQRLGTLASSAPARVTAPLQAQPVVAGSPGNQAARARWSRPVAVTPAQPDERVEDVIELETQWLTLTRAVTEARQRQDQVEAQLFKAEILASSEGGRHGVQVDVIDPAFLPQRPLPPGRVTIVLMFLAVSLTLGVLGALTQAAFDDRLFGAGDADGVARILVEVPRLSSKRRAYVTNG